MTKKDFRIVFLGTPAFAVETLRHLVENDYHIVGVVTMPDKPAGRGQRLRESDVKKYAISQDLPVLQPTNLKDSSFLKDLEALKADLNIVVAFRMLPKEVWNMPKHGTYNLHASLLPQYRGAAPINWAIINGETKTGVTTFKLVHEIDKGNIAHQTKIDIGERDNAGAIHDKLMQVGAKLMLKTVDSIIDGSITLEAQDEDKKELKPAPKIFKEDCEIDWNATAQHIDYFIRGLSPYPAAHTTLRRNNESYNLKIFDVKPIIKEHNHTAGTIVQTHPSQIDIAVNDGYIRVLELQLQGRRRMKTADFLNGFTLDPNDFFK